MVKATIRFYYLVVLLLTSFPGLTQFRFGITGGGSISSVLLSSNVQVDQAQASHADFQKPVYTYYGGLVFQFKAGRKFVIRPGIGYFKKAWEVEANDRGRISTSRFLRKYDVNYLQIPVNVLLTTPLSNGRIYIGIGPYVAYALNGIIKVDDGTIDLEFKKFNEPVFTYLPGDGYKPVQFINHYTINRIDYGISGVIGYEFSLGLFLETGIDIGLQQVCSSYERYDLMWNRTIRDPGSSVKYSIFHAGIGWMFNSKGYRSK